MSGFPKGSAGFPALGHDVLSSAGRRRTGMIGPPSHLPPQPTGSPHLRETYMGFYGAEPRAGL